MATTTTTPETFWQRLLNGRAGFDFVGRSRTWLWVTLGLLALCVLAVLVRGLNFSIEFTGGSSFQVQGATADYTADDLEEAIAGLGVTDVSVQVLDGGAGALVSTPAISELDGLSELDVSAVIAEVAGVDPDAIAVDSIGPRWGQAITRQAMQGLVIFLVVVALYITVRFEWRMALSALATLVHDVGVTIGLYALVGFPISPASVIALLTILGYSLYDTVIVFDRVTEEAAKLTKAGNESYGEVANRALNEVLVRSLSTTATAILPVASLLFIGANLLGADTLQDLALALFIGMAVGAYSSITVATPLLVWLKERQPEFAELKEKSVRRRRAEAAAAT